VVILVCPVCFHLLMKSAERRANLEDSYYLHRFLSDYRDLISWIHDMKTIIGADELAKDVAGGEALLEKHQEHKVNTFFKLIPDPLNKQLSATNSLVK